MSMSTDMIKNAFSIACAIIVICSLGLHAIQAKHAHYGIAHASVLPFEKHVHAKEAPVVPVQASESLADKMHMAEKKFLFSIPTAPLFILIFSLSLAAACRNMITRSLIRCRYLQKLRPPQPNAYIGLLYAAGILNPKLH